MRGPASRLFDSLTTQRPPDYVPNGTVPQGMAVTNSAGKVMEWVLIFDTEATFLSFLKRSKAEHDKDPNAPGKAPVPLSHPKGEVCPGKPPGQRGSLKGTVYGRALDAAGALVKVDDRSRESVYMQENTTVPRRLVDQLAAAARRAAKGEAKVALGKELVERLLREAHLGPKDVRLLGNPRRAPTKRERVELWLEPPAAATPDRIPLKGAVTLEVDRRPMFRHRQELAWTGRVDLDAKGVKQLLLHAQGRYELFWKGGFDREEDRFRGLFGGRTMDEKRGVRFGIKLTRVETGTEEVPAARRNGPPRKLVVRMKRFQRAMRERNRNHQAVMRKVGETMRKFEPLVRARKFDEAIKVLDEALKLLGVDPAEDLDQ